MRGRVGRRGLLEAGGLGRLVAARVAPVPREQDGVSLDHLVEGRGLEPQKPGGVLLHSAGGLERGLFMTTTDKALCISITT